MTTRINTVCSLGYRDRGRLDYQTTFRTAIEANELYQHVRGIMLLVMLMLPHTITTVHTSDRSRKRSRSSINRARCNESRICCLYVVRDLCSTDPTHEHMLDHSDHPTLTWQHGLWAIQIIQKRDLSALEDIDHIDHIDHRKGSIWSGPYRSCRKGICMPWKT